MALKMDWPGRRGRSIRQWSSAFSNFRNVVNDYYCLDLDVKNAVLKASSSVVSIRTRAGGEFLFIGSGTILECDEQHGIATILTSATLLQGPDVEGSIPSDLKIDIYLSDGKQYEGHVSVYDFYYNIATIEIKCTTPLSTASIRYIDDYVAIELEKPILNRHSAEFKLKPGERVIALGRDCEGAREIMASPGILSARDCRYDCKELFLTSCVVTKLAVGGPLINFNGEVIGVNFFICPYNAFVPINIVIKCLEDLKKNGQVPRPWIGASVANLYTADLEKLDELFLKFPDLSRGVIVEQVIGSKTISSKDKTKVHHGIFWSPRDWIKAKAIRREICKGKRKRSDMRRIKRIESQRRKELGMRKKKWQGEQKSPASFAGLCAGDVIVKCGEVSVWSHLEFIEALWDKEGKTVELVLMRPSIGRLTVTLEVGTCPYMPRCQLMAGKKALATNTKTKNEIEECFVKMERGLQILTPKLKFGNAGH